MANDDIISEYNVTQAMSDGTVHRLGTTNNLATNGAIYGVMQRRNITDAAAFAVLVDVVARAAPEAIKTWDAGGVYKLNADLEVAAGPAVYWLIPSELGGVTIMRPDEY